MYNDLVVRWTDGVEQTPTNGRAYYNLASALLRANPPRIAAADSVLHRAMVMDSMYVPTRVRSATIAIAQNRLVDAETLLVSALRLHPLDAPATEKLGTVLLAMNRPDLALPYVKQFAQFNGTGQSLTTLGLTYLMTRQLDSAIVVLRRAAQLDSTAVDTRRYLAGALVEQQRGAEAIPFIRQAIALDPTSGLMFGLLSLAFAQTGQADSAASAAGTAFAKAPDNATAYVFAGRALETIGHHAEAAEYFKQALQLSPNDPQILSRLGMAEASMGHSAVAPSCIREFSRRFPTMRSRVRGSSSSGAGVGSASFRGHEGTTLQQENSFKRRGRRGRRGRRDAHERNPSLQRARFLWTPLGTLLVWLSERLSPTKNTARCATESLRVSSPLRLCVPLRPLR